MSRKIIKNRSTIIDMNLDMGMVTDIDMDINMDTDMDTSLDTDMDTDIKHGHGKRNFATPSIICRKSDFPDCSQPNQNNIR